MKTKLALWVAVLAFVLVWTAIFRLRSGSSAIPRDQERDVALVPSTPDDEAGRMRRLEERVDSLSDEVMRLTLSFEALRASGGERAAVSPADLVAVAPDRDGSWYLSQYVASFRSGGAGSEYFRLGVEAFIPELCDPVIRIVADRSSHQVMRGELTAILGDERLRLQAKVVRVLIGLLPAGADPALVATAIGSLGIVCDAASLPELERRVWKVQFREPQMQLVRLVLELAGERANRSLASLLRSAPDVHAEIGLVRLIRTDDIPGGLDCFEVVSFRQQPTRLAGAHLIHAFRDDTVIAFIDDWAAREQDEEVRRVLLGARGQLTEIQAWSAEQAIGEPNVARIDSDSREAWAALEPDGGHEWIQLGYAPAIRAHEVRVHEVLSAGAVVKVVLIDENGGKHTVWQGDDPLTAPGVFSVPFGLTPYRVSGVRLELDTRRGSSWNEIDAVQLLGPDGAEWAKKARASSSYQSGQPSTAAFGNGLLFKDF